MFSESGGGRESLPKGSFSTFSALLTAVEQNERAGKRNRTPVRTVSNAFYFTVLGVRENG